MNSRLTEIANTIFAIGLFRFLLVVAAVLLLRFSLWSPAIVVVIMLIVIETGRSWSRTGLSNLKVEKYYLPERLFAGENSILKVVISNQKRLPVIIDWKQELPNGLECSGLSASSFIKGYSSFSAQYVITAEHRGFYEISPSTIISNDGVGLFSYQKDIKDKCNLIVYPRLMELTDIAFKASDLIGEMPDQRYILPDPIRIAGLTDYTPDMPARLINWKASAGKDLLMAKMIEPSADYKLCLAVDSSIISESKAGRDSFEKALSIAASITVWADENGIPTGLIINASQTGINGPVSVPVNTGLKHTLLILEKLARVECNPIGTLDTLLWADKQAIPWGTTLILIGTNIKPNGIDRVICIPCQ